MEKITYKRGIKKDVKKYDIEGNLFRVGKPTKV